MEYQVCEEKDCNKPANLCRLFDYDKKEEIEFWYCEEHAFKNGFCICCGEFWGGIEDFDFGNGLCERCLEDVE